MTGGSHAGGDGRELGALVDDIRVRVLNCSATGCLLASDTPVMEGTVATLHLSLGGRTFTDVVKVVRCDRMNGSAGRYHVAVRFLPTTPAYAGSLRHLMGHDAGALGSWRESDDR